MVSIDWSLVRLPNHSVLLRARTRALHFITLVQTLPNRSHGTEGSKGTLLGASIRHDLDKDLGAPLL